jgi:hypothetical protein
MMFAMMWPRCLGRTVICGLMTVGLWGTAAQADQVSYRLTETIQVQDTQLPYTVDLDLSDETPSRLGFDVVLDLRQLQQGARSAFPQEPFIDTCNARLSNPKLLVSANGDSLSVEGQFHAEFYACDRDKLRPIDRGEQVFSEVISLTAAASLNVRGQCLYFGVEDLALALKDPVDGVADQRDFMTKAQDLFIETSDAFLEQHPICLTLPPELASLTPQNFTGGTREMGDGGVGAQLKGSVDVSAATILDVLNALQAKGVIPRRM